MVDRHIDWRGRSTLMDKLYKYSTALDIAYLQNEQK